MKSRQIYSLWALMVILSLILGGGAFLLLYRESQRIEEISDRLLAEKANAIVENLSLLVTETREGLADSLAAFPEESLTTSIRDWPNDNPFVAESFLWDAAAQHLDYFGQSEVNAGALITLWAAEDRTREQLSQKASDPFRHSLSRQDEGVVTDAMPAPGSAMRAMPSAVPAEAQESTLSITDPGAALSVDAEQELAVLGASNAVQARQKVRELTKDIYYEQRAEEEKRAAEAQRMVRQSEIMEMEVAAVAAPETAIFADEGAQPTSRDRSSFAGGTIGGLEFIAQTEPVPASDEADWFAQASLFGELAPVDAEMDDVTAALETAPIRDDPPRVETVAESYDTVEEPAAGEVSLALDAAETGWDWVYLNGWPQLVIWYRPAYSDVFRGIVVDQDTLIDTLRSALPAFGANLLRDDQSSSTYRSLVSNITPRDEFDFVVQIPTQILPSTSLILRRVSDDVFNVSFWIIAGLLIFILVASFFFGGSVFLWIAQRTAMEAQQKTDFLSNVSHELKTPLTTIRMYAEMLEEDRVSSADKQKRYLRTIGGETQRLSRLVNNILEFSALQKGKSRLHLQPTDLLTILNPLMETQAMRAGEEGLTLDWSFPEAAIPVKVDPDAVEQVVINLVDNAIKYAGQGKAIHCSIPACSAGGREVVLEVCDDGPGVPKPHVASIFNPFHRVENDLTATRPGSGLGLSIARSLIRQMGGELEYAARPGGGACFSITLPTHETS